MGELDILAIIEDCESGSRGQREAARRIAFMYSRDAEREYRKGLPTQKQIDAHLARGGWWQWRREDWGTDGCSEMARPSHRGGNRCVDPTKRSELPWALEWVDALWRPCSHDGTPLPWLD